MRLSLLTTLILILLATGCGKKPEAEPVPIGPGTPAEATENIQLAVVRKVMEDESFREPGRVGRWFIGLGVENMDPSDAWMARLGKTNAARKRSQVKVAKDQSVTDPESDFPAMVVYVPAVDLKKDNQAQAQVEVFGGGINPSVYTFDLKFEDDTWTIHKINRPWIQ